MHTLRALSLFASGLTAGVLALPAVADIQLTPIGGYLSNIFDEGAAEISAYDPVTQRLFITNADANTIDVLNIGDPTQPTLVKSISLDAFGGGINSVAFKNGVLAAAVEAEIAQDPGQIVFFNANGEAQGAVTVGALPDMVTFTPDGSRILVANEAEPSDDYSVDPVGSVSIIDISGGISGATVTAAGFTQFNDTAFSKESGVRVFGPGASVAQDFEPEYIAVSADSTRAYVSLQENNAFGVLNLLTGEFDQIVGLGFKDHSQPGNELDTSDRDDAIDIASRPIFGLYQPDAIATFEAAGQTYIISANEGDARDYDGFSEEERVKDLTLDPTAFPDAAALQADEVLGRLTVTTTLGDADGDGLYEELYAFGSRSFSIWDAEGNLVFDSGSQFEQIIAKEFPEFFNSDNGENTFDTRSDAKGPEPEGVTVGEIDGQIYAFIGLERIGGIMVYNISDPSAPTFVQYINNRDFSGDPEAGTAGDLGPEGVLFISAADSPTGISLLAVTNEVSGSTRLYSITNRLTSVPEPVATTGLAVAGLLSLLGLKRQH
ncbi:MAG: alkaline phosphatase [Leptolyngbyaceae cyanobacterium SM1_1_3]|nr:alkaline phosphatase [Leptolyngbyaceae cyanobacterium SM1_1_3]NJN03654.1 alkaline phosphatase [Leptolyngbyaceae cyanobacterium RM1_1_2]NJO09116.1 alkaline phosphatase [Leptolyngbyaceae cyanobacterium SL_1_1]